jgi:hypothetical protein
MKRRVVLVGFFLVVLCVLYMSCGPTVTIDPPDKPIEINVNVRIDIYNHVAAVNDDIYGNVTDEEGNGEPTSRRYILPGVFMQSAYGATDTQNYNEAKDRRKARARDIMRYKKDGSIGEDHLGDVAVIQSDKIKNDKSYASRVKETVKKENSDRAIMYEIDAAKQGVSVDQIRAANALYWRDNSKDGEWIEVKRGDDWVWKRK